MLTSICLTPELPRTLRSICPIPSPYPREPVGSPSRLGKISTQMVSGSGTIGLFNQTQALPGKTRATATARAAPVGTERTPACPTKYGPTRFSKSLAFLREIRRVQRRLRHNPVTAGPRVLTCQVPASAWLASTSTQSFTRWGGAAWMESATISRTRLNIGNRLYLLCGRVGRRSDHSYCPCVSLQSGHRCHREHRCSMAG